MDTKTALQPEKPLDYSMRHTAPTRRYHSFLLRMWMDDETTSWRVQIENPHTREVIGFPSVTELKAFLDEQFSEKGGSGANS